MTEYRYIGVFMVIMSVAIFGLLSTVAPEEGRTKDDETRNGIFSTIAFIVGGGTSLLSGWLGMTIATYANARTAVEARKGVAPAFMCGKYLGGEHGRFDMLDTSSASPDRTWVLKGMYMH
eukprot:362807-Chlamydomonas_euryale.AAC.8